jgi:hypothetical protein
MVEAKRVSGTYSTCSASEATTTSTAASTATTRATLTTLATTCTFAAAYSSFGLFTCWFRLASELDRDLALQYFFPRQFSNGLLGLFSSLEVDKSIADWSVCARVDRDGGSFTTADRVRSS